MRPLIFTLLRTVLAGLLIFANLFAEEAPLIPLVGRVDAPAGVKLRTQVGQPVDAATIAADVKTLWATGRFDDVKAETVEESDGTLIQFHTAPKAGLVLREMRLEPHTFGLQAALPAGTPMDRLRAHQVAQELRNRLIEQGYQDPKVEDHLVPAGGNRVDLHLTIAPGDSVQVGSIEVVGDLGLRPQEVQKALTNLRVRRMLPGIPGLWNGWLHHPPYSDNALQGDLARLRSLYLSKGYFDAKVRLDETEVEGSDARVRIHVQAGQRYQVRNWAVTGLGAKPISELSRREFWVRDLCTCLLRGRRAAEREGTIDFTAELAVEDVPGQPGVVDVTAKADRGQPFRVRRIEIVGAKNYSEATMRRNLLLDEGALLDQRLLRKSLLRLNQSNLFERLNETSVVITTDAKTGLADVTLRVQERKRGIWSLSGPVGPMSLAGPLQFSIGSRLPAWGQGIFETSTYMAQFSLIGFAQPLAKLIPGLPNRAYLPVFSLQRPYTPGEGWRSGFSIAPQLGWRMNAIGYATMQLRQRFMPMLADDRGLTPGLPVQVDRGMGGALYCNAPPPRLNWLRTGAGLGLQVLSMVPLF